MPDPVDVAEVETARAGARHAVNGGRELVREAAISDPRARGWARVTAGKACKFCTLLAGRGAVYTVDTVDFQAHDGCHCMPEPVFGEAAPASRPASRPEVSEPVEEPTVEPTSQDDLLTLNDERLTGQNRPGIDDDPEIVAAAKERFAHAMSREAEISELLDPIVADTNATFQHYGERVKFESSIRDKIWREIQADPSLNASQAAANVTDTNRYTLMWEPDAQFRANHARAVKAFNDQGWETIADKNAWGPGDAYDGMNYKFAKGDDIVEIQFHTPTSAVIKDQSHLLYSKARIMPPGPERDRLLREIMDLWNADRAHVPPGMESVGTQTYYDLT